MSYNSGEKQVPVVMAPPVSHPAPAYTTPPPAGYPTNTDAQQEGPFETTFRHGHHHGHHHHGQHGGGGGFWKGCCAALCCCCVIDMCF